MKALKIIILVLFASVMIYAASDLPYRGDPDNLMHAEESITGTEVVGSYVIQEAYHDAKTPNIVTVILGDYRSVDTFGEQVVVFTAGLITILILRSRRRQV
ncbi:hydrogen gas-evolving membrane-bound hydrogenase subunit E [Rhodohalobacter sp.]|uniref:hydrogen gas-evolving membrane-bound hydrogenase subunit E n=1 Tax=Rhodohalobacter sp. TaxID=1974210 RepID=UPI002ACE1F2E|nr:hydrogen gas-evolving membrane-bound hydrogenase subunit E [Rhodohalobacter sp.]MDZ7758043.1 hydrogen gas-evolving membrane-bound hydrogenase subunit E [Rhodohalobacter sp.]